MQNIVNGLKMRTYNEDKKVFSSVKFGILRKNIKNFLISRKLVTQRNQNDHKVIKKQLNIGKKRFAGGFLVE